MSNSSNTCLILLTLRLRLTARFKKFGQHHHFFNTGKPRRVWLQVKSTQYLWVMRNRHRFFPILLEFHEKKKKKRNQHFFILDAFPVCVDPKVPSHLFTPSRSPPHHAGLPFYIETLLIPLRLCPTTHGLPWLFGTETQTPYSFRAKLLRCGRGKESL